jgi:hypothetical protein
LAGHFGEFKHRKGKEIEMKNRVFINIFCFLGFLAFALLPSGAAAEEKTADLEVIKPTAIIDGESAELRTAEQIGAAEIALAKVPLREFEKPFMPTDDPKEYKAAKLGAGSYAAMGPKPIMAPQENVIPPFQAGWFGVSQGVLENWWPPDTHGAVGDANFVQVVNAGIRVYNKAGGFIQQRTLRALFGATENLFDPRVVYDQTWRRWVIIATRSSTSAADAIRRFYLAISTTSDPAGSYYVYVVPYPFNAGDWCDFPQLGMNQDAIFMTTNVFTYAGVFQTTAMIAWAKARLYNGLGWSVPVFQGLAPTLAPPIALDQNIHAFFIAANTGTTLHLYRGTYLSNAAQAVMVLQAQVPVPAYSVPPNAPQLGTTQLIDTLDRRFVNASTQYADQLWNVHTINLAGYAAPKFYQIDTAGTGANTVFQQGFFFEGSTSHDFNVSITANQWREVFVTWNSTDVTNATVALRHNARIRTSGRVNTDPLGVISAGQSILTSTVPLTGNPSGTAGVQRWGDYSAVTLDPTPTATCAATRRAWFVNEWIAATNQWGSIFGRMGFCQ